MSKNSKEIIEYIERNYPSNDKFDVRNLSDLNIEATGRLLNQYIIGVTPNDRFGSGISHYEHRMKERLSKVSPCHTCLPWPFYDYELDELKTTLRELSEYFNADLDIEKMIGNLKIRQNNGELYYVVITVVQYPILYVES